MFQGDRKSKRRNLPSHEFYQETVICVDISDLTTSFGTYVNEILIFGVIMQGNRGYISSF